MKEVISEYLRTNEMIADVFTKAVTPQKLEYLTTKFGVYYHIVIRLRTIFFKLNC